MIGIMKKNKKVLLASLISIMWVGSGYLNAQIDLRPSVKSVDLTIKDYSPSQKIKLHLKFSILYAKNDQWEEFYSHFSSIFTLCPALKKKKIIISDPGNYLNQTSPVILPPEIIQKLAPLGLKDLNTRQKVLLYLEYLEPLCQKVCPDNKSIK